jgi:hypothetical protein
MNNNDGEPKNDIYRIVCYIFIFGGLLTTVLGFITFNPVEEVPVSFMPHDYSNILFTFGLGFTSIGVAVISIGISIESGIIAKKSKEIAEASKVIAEESKSRMETIGEAEIQQCIIDIESIRREYFYGIQEFLITPLSNRRRVNLSHLQQINAFTTWQNYEFIEKALRYKEYMTDRQKLRLFRLHRTLIEVVLPNCHFQIVSNESVHQLLMGINKLYEELEDPNEYQIRFYEVLNGYLGYIEEDEEFLEFISRVNTELDNRGHDNLFVPF